MTFKTIVIGVGLTCCLSGGPVLAQQKGGPVTVSNASVEFHDGIKNDGKVYPRIAVDVLVNKKPQKGVVLTTKASCQVGAKKMSDKGIAVTSWSDLDEGETKRVDMAPFVSNPLDSTPTSCEFSIRWGKLTGDPKEVAKYCWSGDGVKDGPCPKNP